MQIVFTQLVWIYQIKGQIPFTIYKNKYVKKKQNSKWKMGNSVDKNELHIWEMLINKTIKRRLTSINTPGRNRMQKAEK